jgi:zinc/manganese transport system ATP-binding protein
VLSVDQLCVRRGPELVLDQLSFRLQPGTLTALVGPNGAGKSTLLQTLEGQLSPAAGSITWEGLPLTPALARQQLALMPQRGEIAWGFPITVRALVALGRLAGQRPGCCDVEAALQRVGLMGLGVALISSPAVSSRGPCWRAPWCNRRECCCWMNPAQRSIRPRARSCCG